MMTLSFDLFKVVDVKNPSEHCTEVYFSDDKNSDLKRRSLVIFEQQVKYITTEEYETNKRVKIYIIDDKEPILIDFHQEEYKFFEALFSAIYNKNI